MSRNRKRSQVFRKVAQDILGRTVPEEWLCSQKEDLVTSLVRQWLTYDGNAMLVFQDQELDYRLIPQKDSYQVAFKRETTATWLRQLMRDWKIDPQHMEEALRQLNFSQSAQVENQDGIPLRLAVNPRTGTKMIEPLQPNPKVSSMNPEQGYRKMAGDMVENCLGEGLPPIIQEELIASLVRQWLTQDGHGLILTANVAFLFKLWKNADGWQITKTRLGTDLGQKLLSWGVPPEQIGQTVHRLNLGQSPELRNSFGQRGLLVTDPKSGRVELKLVDTGPASGTSACQFTLGL